MPISQLQEYGLEAGRRDRWVTIEAFTPAATASGFPGGTWATLATVAMSRRETAADERIRAEFPAAFLQTVWIGPYRPDMDPDLVDVPASRRLVYAGRRYDITAAAVIGRHQGIELETLAASKV
jgi:Phage head-tail joining protein